MRTWSQVLPVWRVLMVMKKVAGVLFAAANALVSIFLIAHLRLD